MPRHCIYTFKMLFQHCVPTKLFQDLAPVTLFQNLVAYFRTCLHTQIQVKDCKVKNKENLIDLQYYCLNRIQTFVYKQSIPGTRCSIQCCLVKECFHSFTHSARLKTQTELQIHHIYIHCCHISYQHAETYRNSYFDQRVKASFTSGPGCSKHR